MLDRAALVVAQIGDCGPAGTDGGLHVVAAKAFEGPHLELVGEGVVRGIGGKVPVFDVADGHSRQGGLKRLHPLGVRACGDEELGRGEAL